MSTGEKGKKSVGGIAGLALLALAGLARQCDDIGRLAARHLDDIAPSHADDLGRLSVHSDDAAGPASQQIDALLNSQSESAYAEEASAVVSMPAEAPGAVREELREAAKEVGKKAAEEALTAGGGRGDDENRNR